MGKTRLEQFKELLALDPNDAVLRYGLGEEYLKAGRIEEAAREFRALVELKPDYTAAYRQLGKALERQGRADEAREAYRKGIEVAEKTGDLQTKKEMQVFVRRLEKAPE